MDNILSITAFATAHKIKLDNIARHLESIKPAKIHRAVKLYHKHDLELAHDKALVDIGNAKNFFCRACGGHSNIPLVIRKGANDVCQGCIDRMTISRNEEAKEIKEAKELIVKTKKHGLEQCSPEFRKTMASYFLDIKKTKRAKTEFEQNQINIKQRRDDLEYERELAKINNEW